MRRRSRVAGAAAADGAALNFSDADLVRSAQDGDMAALEQLLSRHQDRVHALCRRITGEDEAGLDATQEALIAIARGVARFDGRSSFSTWVYRVATNAALDEVRRRKRRPVLLSGASSDFDGSTGRAAGTAGPPWLVSGVPESDSPDISAAVSERIDLDKALRAVPEDQRAAIVLRDLLDFDYSAIAQILDVPVGTVKSRIARGRATLAGVIESADSGEPARAWNQPTPTKRQIKGENSVMRG
jgi:RNA polymerase sigma-70 factor (ECF subfamily)